MSNALRTADELIVVDLKMIRRETTVLSSEGNSLGPHPNGLGLESYQLYG